MTRRVIVHSFHSDVLETLANIDLNPDLILACDSHLDVFLSPRETVDLLPDWIRPVATRATVHPLIRRIFGDFLILLKAKGMEPNDLPRMKLVVPEASFIAHISMEFEKISAFVVGGSESRDQRGNPSETMVSYLSETLGIEPFFSPPKDLMKLAELGEDADCIVFDLDVDYLQEMQTECYSPMRNAQPEQLAQLFQVAELIRKIEPQIITISEAKTAAIKDSKSNFSKLINQLERMDYQVTYKTRFKNDEQAQELMKIYREFYEKALSPLLQRQRFDKDVLSANVTEGQMHEQGEVIRRYFARLPKPKSTTYRVH